MLDRKAFFDAMRGGAMFPAGLKQQQVDRIGALLDAIDNTGWPLAWAAYALATAHHETAKWQHMRELGGADYFKRMYDKGGSRPHVAKTLGNVVAGDGVKFAGRGFVQLTGRTNYTKAGTAIGLDLLKEPDLAADPDAAARILIWGMQTGAYTGKKNADYLSQSPPDYAGARRIINGTDRAALIASYAQQFADALATAGYGSPAPPKPAPEPPRHDGKFEAPASEQGFLARFFSALFRRLKGAA